MWLAVTKSLKESRLEGNHPVLSRLSDTYRDIASFLDEEKNDKFVIMFMRAACKVVLNAQLVTGCFSCNNSTRETVFETLQAIQTRLSHKQCLFERKREGEKERTIIDYANDQLDERSSDSSSAAKAIVVWQFAVVQVHLTRFKNREKKGLGFLMDSPEWREYRQELASPPHHHDPFFFFKESEEINLGTFLMEKQAAESKQYIPHEYILLTDRNDTSGRSFNRCESLEAFLISEVFQVLGGYWIPKSNICRKITMNHQPQQLSHVRLCSVGLYYGEMGFVVAFVTRSTGELWKTYYGLDPMVYILGGCEPRVLKLQQEVQ
ncbi:hypothetical protein ALC57_08223 [Trachymyrmex cornetzi]|uniref:Uncharacterized protein n=1 Tax=Trachymyrmex cornetzi TaxID=471704 RepID=A0A195E300_9HYME|nr:hypothetical protein ALC57_08223 [Trachymyrmex cornetzi]